MMKALQAHIPNALTLARFPLGAAFAYCYVTDQPVAGVLCVLIGCFTDWLDGKLARLWRVTSDFGKIADAYADKCICWIMTAVALDILGPNPILLTLTLMIFGYDAGLSYLRYTLGHRDIPVSWYAKAKTAVLMVALIFVYLGWAFGDQIGSMFTALAHPMLIGSGVLAMLSTGNYLRGYKLEKHIPYPFSLIM